MEKRKFGNTDMMVSVLGFGGAEIGFQSASQKDVEKLLNTALDTGLNVIDTAECYINSEELIGNAISHRRKDFYLFSKCGHGNTNDFNSDGWDKNDLAKSIDRSLKRLKTDYLDLIQLHSCSENELKKGEAIEVIQNAKKEGKVRYIGYSGDSQAALYAIETGIFDTLQTSINIADQESIDLLLPKARAKNLGVIAKRPIANAAWKENSRPGYFYIQEYWDRLQELKYDFINGDIAKSVNIALRFTLSLQGVHTAIVGTKKINRWQENAKFLDEGRLDDLEINKIRQRWQTKAKAEWIGQV